MANSKIFCNIPWFEININHDGSYDLCGCQNDRLLGTELGQVYNIKKIPIADYWNSDRLKESRLLKLGNVPDPKCKMCQQKDAIGYASNRVKENNKSVIFNEAFDRSFEQSRNYEQFKYSEYNDGATKTTVHSLHVNLGDTCNFACRMCGPYASTKLQTEFKQLGWLNKDLRIEHWTENEAGWGNFLKFLEQQAKDIKVVHIIGGEVNFMPKFLFLINYFIDAGLAKNVNISFTSNGSVDYSKYFDLLAQYKRSEIGFSIESIDPIGNYIRQGGDNIKIMKNIDDMIANKPANMSFTIRTVPSLLSLVSYANLIKWARGICVPIDNSLLVSPAWQQAVLLPNTIKQKVIKDLTDLVNSLPKATNQFNNQKNSNNIDISIRNECESIINLAKQPAPSNADTLRKLCAENLSKWDTMKRINIKDYSVELYDFLTEYGYAA
jgi:hypothetical protein